MRRILPIILLAVLIALVLRLVTLGPRRPEHRVPDGELAVHFIDVGQGDCTLIQTPDGRNLLVDAGDQDNAKRALRYLLAQGVRRIDLLLISHPHADHIGGLPLVLDTFGVSSVIDAGWDHGSPVYEQVLSRINERRIDYRLVGKDPVLAVGSSVRLELFRALSGSLAQGESAVNNQSVVVLLRYKDVGVLMPGDIQFEGESELLAARRDLRCTILKVAHHGSGDSTSNEFLQLVRPMYAVVSVGGGNPYGHPSNATIRRLSAAGAKVFRTDRDGSVVFMTNGKRVRAESRK